LECFLRLGGYLFSLAQEDRNRVSSTQKGVYKIMCVGESTTAHFLVKEPYPAKLERILNESKAGINFSVINKGMIAKGTLDIMAQLQDNLDHYKPDMVIAMMGINDCGYLAPQLRVSFWGRLRVYRLMKVICLAFMKGLNDFTGKIAQCGASKDACDHVSPPYLLKTPSPQHSLHAVRPDACEDDMAMHQGSQYQDQGEYSLAEDAYKKLGKAHPSCANAYFNLGRLYYDWTQYAQAAEAFRKGLEIDPHDAAAYFGLGLALRELKRYSEIEGLFKKSIELDAHTPGVYLMSGYFYRDNMKDFINAEKSFKQAIDAGDDNYMAYRELAKTYIIQKKYDQTEELFRVFKEKYPENDRIYQDLIQLYEYRSREESLREDDRKAEELRGDCFWRVTAKNYRLMKKVLDARGIKLVCVQYPMRSIEPLRKIFYDSGGIIYVDNEKIFKDALSASRFDEYFMDRMFEDFGHCTEKGNELLAGNVAKSILKELLKK